MYSIKQKGMTLIELTVVLLILVALAGLTIPYVSGTSRKALCDATDVSMANIKRVIMEGYYLDTLGYFPKETKDTIANYSLHYLIEKGSTTAPVFSSFDPDSQLGWRGPYVSSGVKLSALAVTFGGAVSNYVHEPLTVTQFHILDAWGDPIIIQKYASNGFRLISAGFNKIFETEITGDRSGDDRVIYLDMPAPESNLSCST